MIEFSHPGGVLKRQALASLLMAMLAGIPATVFAQTDIGVQFMGTHGGKANLRVDRKPALLGAGESYQGIKLLSVSPKAAVLRVNGKSFSLQKGAKTAKRLADEVVIENRRGMFFIEGQVNGKRTPFVVDTGASHVVLSGAEARRLRLRYSTHDPVRINTASGRDLAYAVTLDSVSIGGIVMSKVPALITRGKAPNVGLLGMSFLNKLHVTQSGAKMRLSR
jgi:aspartyl protease family protein